MYIEREYKSKKLLSDPSSIIAFALLCLVSHSVITGLVHCSEIVYCCCYLVTMLLLCSCLCKIKPSQGGITCGAIDELRKSSKTIDERVIINFPDKNVVIARFRDKTLAWDKTLPGSRTLCHPGGK